MAVKNCSALGVLTLSLQTCDGELSLMVMFILQSGECSKSSDSIMRFPLAPQYVTD